MKAVTKKRWLDYACKEGISKKGTGKRASQQALDRAIDLLVTDLVGRSGDLFWLKAQEHGGEHTNTP